MEIKRKTGIEDTGSPFHCRTYMEKYHKIFGRVSLAPEQVTLLRRYSNDSDVYKIAREEKMPLADLIAKVGELCISLAIFVTDYRTQRAQLKIYLAAFHPLVGSEKITPHHLDIMRRWANGETFEEIAASGVGNGWELPQYIRHAITHSCRQLGIISRGRDAQLGLVRAYLAQLDAQKTTNPDALAKEDPMDDPAF